MDLPDIDSSLDDAQWIVHVEVRLSQRSTARLDAIRNLVRRHLEAEAHIRLSAPIPGWKEVDILRENVESIAATESSCPHLVIDTAHAIFEVHVYQCSSDNTGEELTSGGGQGEEEVAAATVCELPSKAWDGLWNTLVYPDNIRERLLNYIYATLVFSDAGVDFNVVSWNRVVLLHGPPGTGKTSLCRALAQKLSIRLSDRYAHSKILEINSHSLFSRWFSESGKLVQRLFSGVLELVEDEEAFVIVLIDEVESLTAARAGAMAGNEPSDALRVVNALLTQLDKLKHKKNVLVMATSNLVKAIDSAFVDRADIVQFIDLPGRDAVFKILQSCLMELCSRGIVKPVTLPPLDDIRVPWVDSRMNGTPEAEIESDRALRIGRRLWALAETCKGMSGRALRRLPVLAHAQYLGMGIPFPSALPRPKKQDATVNGKSASKARSSASSKYSIHIEAEVWLDAMEKVVQNELLSKLRVL
ncbi:P-loop containing nucleoside triphosphate hydrolase protein [Sistotremastrum niveocremeum HHB9708]|uniref:p-loop containing nucleoside triphosphate hydrolase protein n=1 Tax=Sistotremastrum niveocremeum HHB9708 TaxID=1314777 RepID=A0A164Z3Z0_9AGAM|nr:P-loop containing nucleoside triphosphate hydrolase protein [Sistotremastrum niveocremeum HHB9708]